MTLLLTIATTRSNGSPVDGLGAVVVVAVAGVIAAVVVAGGVTVVGAVVAAKAVEVSRVISKFKMIVIANVGRVVAFKKCVFSIYTPALVDS